jgi:Uma2 family endonuclease
MAKIVSIRYYRRIVGFSATGIRAMATVTERRYTPKDLLKISDRPTPDLVDGVLEEREPMGQTADAVILRIGAKLVAYGDSVLPGVANGPEGGLQIFSGKPNQVRFPDASFTKRDRLPGGQTAEGHSRVVPDLVVEVISPNDRACKLRRKIRDYRDAGVPMMWVADPGTREIEVILADGTAVFLHEAATLDGGEALPGFRCSVSELFGPAM